MKKFRSIITVGVFLLFASITVTYTMLEVKADTPSSCKWHQVTCDKCKTEYETCDKNGDGKSCICGNVTQKCKCSTQIN